MRIKSCVCSLFNDGIPGWVQFGMWFVIGTNIVNLSIMQLFDSTPKLGRKICLGRCVLSFVLVLSISPNECLAADEELVPSLVFFEDFGGITPLDKGRFRVHGSEPAIGGDGNLVATLQRTPVGVNYRSELVPSGLPIPHFTGGQEAVIGPVYWYSVRIRLNPPYAPDSDSGESLLQWVGMADSPEGPENARNPAAALMIRGDRYAFAARADSKPVTPAYGTPKRYTRDELLDLGTYADDVGVWTCWAVNLRWNYMQQALLTIWKNGEILVNEIGTELGYNDQRGPVFKFGLYKWAWSSRETQARSRRLEFDDLAIGTGMVDGSMFLPNGCINHELVKNNSRRNYQR